MVKLIVIQVYITIVAVSTCQLKL